MYPTARFSDEAGKNLGKNKDCLFKNSYTRDYLLDVLSKSRSGKESYEALLHKTDHHGYVVISIHDMLSEFKDISVYCIKDKQHDKYIEVSDVVKVKRYYLRQMENFSDYQKWVSDCFPMLIFHENAFKYINRIGKCSFVNEELTRHLSVLNDVGLVSYHYYRGREKEVLSEFASGYQVICSGKGSNEEAIFHEEMVWEGSSYQLTCNPHTKLFKKNSDQRIYFCWGRTEIDGHKIIIVRIGNHWN